MLLVLLDESIVDLTSSQKLASSSIEKVVPSVGLVFLSLFLVHVLY